MKAKKIKSNMCGQMHLKETQINRHNAWVQPKIVRCHLQGGLWARALRLFPPVAVEPERVAAEQIVAEGPERLVVE